MTVAAPAVVTDGMAALRREGCSAIVEIGGQDVPPWRGLLDRLAALYLAAAYVDLDGLDRGYARRVVSLPTYPFQRRRHWLPDLPERKAPSVAHSPSADIHPLLGHRIRSAIARSEIEYESTLTLRQLPFLADHRLFDSVLLPSSVYLEMVFAAAGELFGNVPLEVTKYQILRGATLDPDGARALHVILRPQTAAGTYAFEILAADAVADPHAARWITHATGFLGSHAAPRSAADLLPAIRSRLMHEPPVAVFYDRLRRHGLQLGSRFQVVERLWTGDDEALGDIRLPDDHSAGEFRIDPVLLDAAFQVVGAAMREGTTARPFVQVGIERMTLHGAPGRHVLSHARLRGPAPLADDGMVADVQLFRPDGTLVALIEGVQLKPPARDAAAAPDDITLSDDTAASHLYETQWQARPLQDRVPLAPDGDIRGALAAGIAQARADRDLLPLQRRRRRHRGLMFRCRCGGVERPRIPLRGRSARHRRRDATACGRAHSPSTA